MAIIDQTTPYSADDPETLTQFDRVIDQYLTYSTTTMTTLEQIQAQDPNFVMGHVFRGYQLKSASDPRFLTAIDQSLIAAQAAGGTDREQLHIQALDAWRQDDTLTVTAILDQILIKDPTDLIALKAANHLHFYRGDVARMRDSIERSLPHFPQDHPWRSFVVGMLSFGHEECGNYSDALACGEAAVAEQPMDMWAAHAVGHVHEMQKTYSAGIDWLEACDRHWDQTNNFRNHLIWHKALMFIGQDRLDEALNLYDQELTDCLNDDFYLDVCNAASLLWRLEMKGIDVEDRWFALTDYQHRANDQELLFIALHYLMIQVRTASKTAKQTMMAPFELWSRGEQEQGQLCQRIGTDLASGIIHIAGEDPALGVRHLEKALPELQSLGGSHAQRMLFTDFIQHYA